MEIKRSEKRDYQLAQLTLKNIAENQLTEKEFDIFMQNRTNNITTLYNAFFNQGGSINTVKEQLNTFKESK